MKIHLLPFFLLCVLTSSKVTQAQETICQLYEKRFLAAVDSGILSEIELNYLKLLRACGVYPGAMGMLAGSFENRGAQVHWNADQSYQVRGLFSPEINMEEYYGVLEFEQLPTTSPVRLKYKTLSDFLKAIRIDENDLALQPLFIPALQVVWIKEYGKDYIINEQTLKNILSFPENNGGLNYGGNGLFYSNLQDRTFVFSIQINKKNPVANKILDVIGGTSVYPISNNTCYLAVEQQLSDKSSVTLYNQEGKMLVKDLDLVLYNPLSITFVLAKNNLGKLVDRQLKTLIDQAVYMEELINQDISYFVYRDQTDRVFITDKQGKNVFEGMDYEIYHAPQNKYVLVDKNNQFGVVDFATKKVLVPFDDARVYEIYPGFLTRNKAGVWHIFDEQATEIGTIPVVNMEVLTTSPSLLLKVIDERGKFGVYDLFGNQIVPIEFDVVAFDSKSNRIEVQSDKEHFYTDLKGNKLD